MIRPKTFALYVGGEFVDIGTIAEISERTGIPRASLYWWRKSKYRNRRHQLPVKEVVEIEDDTDDLRAFD